MPTRAGLLFRVPPLSLLFSDTFVTDLSTGLTPFPHPKLLKRSQQTIPSTHCPEVAHRRRFQRQHKAWNKVVPWLGFAQLFGFRVPSVNRIQKINRILLC